MEKLKMKKNMYPGSLITFCGLDGCGKTTTIHALSAYLQQKGYSVVLTKQPTPAMRQSPIFRNYMDCPKHDGYAYRSLSLMAAADRIQHGVNEIEPLLQEGNIVISDRYFYSCLANLHARGYEKDRWIYEIAESVVEPDAAIFLDVDVETAVERVRSRKEEKERYIDMPLQYRLRKKYLEIADINQCPVFSSKENQAYMIEQVKTCVMNVVEKKESQETLDKNIEYIILRYSALEGVSLNDNMRLSELGYDSFSKTELIVSLEEQQGFEFPLEMMHPDNFVTVGSVKRTVKDALQLAQK